MFKKIFFKDGHINRQIVVTTLSIILTIILVISTSYAAFVWDEESNAAQNILSGAIGAQITNTSGTLTLEDAYPKTTTEALADTSSYSFTVQNTSANPVYYSVKLVSDTAAVEADGCSENQIGLEYIDWYIGNYNSNMVNSISYNNEIVSEGYLGANANQSFELKIWINKKAPNSVVGSHFHGKLVLEYKQANNYVKLTDKIIENNSPVVTTTPDFNTVATTDEGLIQGTDDDGTTYYFRGAVEDNYLRIDGLKWTTADKLYVNGVHGTSGTIWGATTREDAESDCDEYYESDYGYSSAEACKNDITEMGHDIGDDILFRIVRINGTGTTRIIINDRIGTSAFNTNYNEEKYVGYTYDNSSAGIHDGEDSTIKEYLDTWYRNNMSSYDSLIATEKFCNDTSVSSTSGSNIYFGARERIHTNKTPQFTCPTTTKTYGGVYNLKVGLLSADEAAFAGGKYGSSNSSYYLNKPYWWWAASPYNSRSGSAYVYGVGYDGGMGSSSTNGASGSVVPVFNLKSGLLYSSGSGTKTDPYVVSVS